MDRRATALSALFHHRWAPATLATLHAARGAKLVTLANRLRAPRDSVRSTLDALADRGLVKRNPGYGHPMRPEWILTAAGERLAPACAAVLEGARRAGLDEVARRKWGFPVLLALLDGSERFSELAAALPGATPRALAATLRALAAAGAVHREVMDDHPPRVRYTANRAAHPMRRLLRRLGAAA